MRNFLTSMGMALAVTFAAPAVAGPPMAAAISPAFEYTAADPEMAEGPFTLGFSFTLTQPTSVNALGYFGGGLGSNRVGIWNSDGSTLLTSTTVTTSDPLVGNFRYGSIVPVLLAAGNYVIGGEIANLGAFPGVLSGVTTAPGYFWTGHREIAGGFAFPSTPQTGFGNQSIALVNFSIAAVPEPATWALMLLGFGVVGTTLRRRRKVLAVA